MSAWTWGQVACDRYFDAWREQIPLPLGLPWPEWEDLSLEEKEAWSAAAQAVRDAAAK